MNLLRGFKIRWDTLPEKRSVAVTSFVASCCIFISSNLGPTSHVLVSRNSGKAKSMGKLQGISE